MTVPVITDGAVEGYVVAQSRLHGAEQHIAGAGRAGGILHHGRGLSTTSLPARISDFRELRRFDSRAFLAQLTEAGDMPA